MSYVLAQAGEVVAYPYSFAQLRRDNPDVSFPREPDDTWLAEQGVHKVDPTEPPGIHPSIVITEGPPVLVEGVWTQVWEVTDAPPPTKAELIAHARDKRREKEFGGVTIAGIPVETDERSQTKIVGARVAADADPDWSTVWSGADHGLYPVNAVAMVAISNAVQSHVNGCFTTYATVVGEIEAETITTYAQVDGAFA